MRRENEKGITLIALIITVIVMIILVIVTINAAIGDGGVINRTRQASREHKLAEVKEIIEMAKVNAYDLEFQDWVLSSLEMSEYDNLQLPVINLKVLLDTLNQQFAKEIEEGTIEVELTTELGRALQINENELTAEQQEELRKLSDLIESITLLDDINRLNKFYHEHSSDRGSVTLADLQAVVSGPDSLVYPTQEDFEEWQNAVNLGMLGQFESELRSSNFFLMLIAIYNIQTAQVTVTYIDPPYDNVQYVIYINGTQATRSQEQLDWMYEEKNGELTLTKYTGKKTNIVVPSEIDGKPVVAIDKYVLTGGVEAQITGIKDFPIDNSGTLFTLTRENYKQIVPAFNDAFGFTLDPETCTFNELKTAAKAAEIDGVFYITQVYEPFGLIQTRGPVNLTIPSSVKTIKEDAFEGTLIQSVSLPEGITVEEHAFHDTFMLKKLSIPKNAIIETGAFSYSGIEQLTIGTGARLGPNAFGWTLIEKLDIPSGVTLSDRPFRGIDSLKVVRIAGGVEGVQDAFLENDGVETIILGEGLTVQPMGNDWGVQPYGIFSDTLKEIYLPASVVRYFVDNYAPSASEVQKGLFMHYQGTNMKVYAVVPSEWTSANKEANKETAEIMATGDEYYQPILSGSTVTFIWSDETGYKNPPSSI